MRYMRAECAICGSRVRRVYGVPRAEKESAYIMPWQPASREVLYASVEKPKREETYKRQQRMAICECAVDGVIMAARSCYER